MVGTPEYQLIFSSRAWSRNFRALNPPVQQTEAPFDMLVARTAISPWIWNSGMMFRQWSLSVSSRLAAILRADAMILRCISGTTLGRDVVPDVCRTSASLSAPAGVASASASNSLKAPAGSLSPTTASTTGIDSALAAARTGFSLPASTMTSFGARSSR